MHFAFGQHRRETPRIFKFVSCGFLVSYAFQREENIVLAAVKQNGLALQYASHALKNDEIIVRAAINQNGQAIIMVGDSLRDNQELVFRSLKNDLSMLIPQYGIVFDKASV